jgi:hypothetical protein
MCIKYLPNIYESFIRGIFYLWAELSARLEKLGHLSQDDEQWMSIQKRITVSSSADHKSY